MDSLPDPLAELGLQGLPELHPLSAPWSTFSIPRLEDKPQDPIISSLERIRDLKALPDVVTFNSAIIIPGAFEDKVKHGEDVEDIWLEATERKHAYKNHLVSWDTLRSTYRYPKSPSPFISEQSPDVITFARSHARLRPSILDVKPLSISAAELHDALGLTLVGCASVLHDWDAAEERFIPVGRADEKVQIVLHGMDEVVSESYISRFIDFGTMLRRLEILVTQLRITARDNNSTVFAFAHSLSSALVWVRSEITDVLSGVRNAVCDIWIAFQDIQAVLSALTFLCSRDIKLVPRSYTPLPRIPQKMLSHIYDFLVVNVERQAPRVVRAILSYILTVTSRPYFASLTQSIGLVGLEDMLANSRRKATKALDETLLGEQEDNDAGLDSELELENDIKEEFPSFVSDENRDAIIRARRSIRILSSPEFEGGETIDLPAFRKLEWVWTDDEVSRRALGQEVDDLGSGPIEEYQRTSERVSEAPLQRYKPELVELAVFDLEPGSLSRSSDGTIVTFISSYPTYPPALAPTLPLLAEHILAPASAQAAALGRAALRRFLAPGTPLHLRAHLVLLRAYLLLAAPAFKARLAAALFSDADADDDADDGAEENPMAVTIRTRARNANWRAVRGKKEKDRGLKGYDEQPWAVGLAFGLMEREQWPPGGSDLSFYLRRVIMDSLEHVRDSESIFTGDGYKNELGDDEFWDEAESRLGFAIRDLPVGMGREKWLDPTSIEALDFLYMEYRPPRPLRCLITPDILSKYQRVFAFLLRLLRVETAMRLVFRLTRPFSSGRIFAEYPDTQNLVLHFRFIAQAFLSALSAYIADTAVRGNIDAFLARVRFAEVAAASGSDADGGLFVDVYALMQRHSRVLDVVLAACLLRGAQRAVGDILRALLEVILEFAVLVGNAYRSAGANPQNGSFDEKWAALRVEALYAKFCKTRDVLIKALRKVTERGSKGFAMEGSNRSQEGLPSAPGGMEAISDLLLRLGDTNGGKK